MGNSNSRQCIRSGASFSVSPLEERLRSTLGAPAPLEHPRERARRLAAFNNYFNLYNGVCAATGEKLIQMFRPNSVHPVFSTPYWWSDSWDATSYGRPYDFSQHLFAQMRQLLNDVPQPALSVNYATNEDCAFVNGMSFSKSCYLCFLCVHCQDCTYCSSTWRSSDCVDCSSTYDSELCYDCVFATKCYDLRHAFNCSHCSQSAFLRNCIGCHECFGCTNMRQARYCFFNEQLSESSYRDRMAEVRLDSRAATQRWEQEFLRFAKRFPQPAVRGASALDSTGDFLEHCVSAERCFDCSELEDAVNCFKVTNSKNCVDLYSWGAGSEYVFNSCRVGTTASHIWCCDLVYGGTAEMEYCYCCFGCQNCFGCVGLRSKQYCILNRQYSKDEYFDLRGRIIAQMSTAAEIRAGRGYGEFFPYELSLYPYIDSDAMLFYPLDAATASRLSIPWEHPTPDTSRAAESASAELPDSVQDMPGNISEQVFRCESSHRPFRLSTRELNIHQKLRIPLSSLHWKTRMEERAARINFPELHDRFSDLSGQPLQTSFPPGSDWTVWSREEYEKATNG